MKLLTMSVVLIAMIFSSSTMAKKKEFDGRDHYSTIRANKILEEAKEDGVIYTFDQVKKLCLCQGDVGAAHRETLNKGDKMTKAERESIMLLLKSCATQNGVALKYAG